MADSRQAAMAVQAPGGSRISTKLIALVALAMLLVAGGTAYFMTARKPAPGTAGQQEEPFKLPRFVDVEPFTVNLAEKEQDRYMQIRFSLEVASTQAETTIKEMLPAMRSEILLVLSGRPAAELITREGKEALAKDIVTAANHSLEHTGAEHSVTAVRITQLIVQ